jgi:hemin uptake protein HemP
MDIRQTQRGPQESPALDTGKPVPVEHLLGGRASIRISHNGQVYQLSLTRNDKLILTK